MGKRVFTAATWLSTALLLLVCAAAIASYWLPARNHHLSVSQGFHVGVRWGRGIDIRLVFFNESVYGPYRGSMIRVMGSPPFGEERACGDKAGVYYRYFRDGPDTLWTLMVSIWYPATLFALLPAFYGLRKLWDTPTPAVPEASDVGRPR